MQSVLYKVELVIVVVAGPYGAVVSVVSYKCSKW